MIEIVPYSPDRFDEGYYCRGERGGFRNYEYDHPDQQEQLAIKWSVCQTVQHKSALFVGCARGYEVVYWQLAGLISAGVDVSQWAIQNVHKEAINCFLFNGINLPMEDSSFDLVCAFDVLTIPPFDMVQKLVADMVRVAKNGIVIRTIVKNWRNLNDAVDGTDGTSYTYQTLETWDKLFTQSGKFKLYSASMAYHYETVLIWKAV